MTENFGAGWDLGEVLAERDQPKTSVGVYLNEVASYAKGELIKQLATVKENPDAFTAINDQLEELEKSLEATKYTVHITAVPSRMREDIASKAMHEFPMKLDLMGRDDPNNALDRMKHEQDLIWQAQIFDVVNPAGQHKTDWTLEQIKQFSEALPTPAQKEIDVAIKEITKKAERYSVASKSVDFS